MSRDDDFLCAWRATQRSASTADCASGRCSVEPMREPPAEAVTRAARPACYLVIDVEATCDDAGAVPGPEMEIIEVGALFVDGDSLAPLEEFQTFVRPVRHPRLTAFCTQLTTITQAMVDAAPAFPEAMAALSARIHAHGGPPQVLFASWGAYDRSQFEQDCRYHSVAWPFGPDHLNLKAQFSERRGSSRRFGMAQALRVVGLPLAGTHHRGIDDARNIARLLPFIV